MKKKKYTEKACLRAFIDCMNAKLKKYDIAAKLPRGNDDIEFIFGKSWISALKNQVAAFISQVYVTSPSYDIFSDDYKWRVRNLPAITLYVREINCFHMDGTSLDAYNSYFSVYGDLIAKYFAEFRKVAAACERVSSYLEKL